MGYNHRYHLRCVYREPQFPFIPLLSLSLTYVGNILVRRYRPLTVSAYEKICSRVSPAVAVFFCTLTEYSVLRTLLWLPCGDLRSRPKETTSLSYQAHKRKTPHTILGEHQDLA